MRILLIGEFSRLHNSLKEGLQKLGHEVVLLGYGDSFKDYPVDFRLEKKWNKGWLKKIKIALYKLTGFDIASYFTYCDFWKMKTNFTGFDVVQLINENSFYCEPVFEKKILEFMFANNKKTFLLSCGDDYTNVKYHFENPEIKSIIQPYLEGKIKKKHFLGVLKFRRESFKELHDFIFENISGVIATDLDYHIPMLGHPKYIGLIPNPVNVDKMVFHPMETSGKTTIFLGINDESYYKKGCDFFEKALVVIRKKYPEIDIIVSRSIPYSQYINLYDKAHILLDQAYAFDQGYNALEAMSKGKVVFTGAESAFNSHYNLAERVAVNAVPNVEILVKELEYLIENPEEIKAIGMRARQFIEREHHYVAIAGKYLNAWKS